ncbi:MAG: DUF1292 domain-containing protein [Eubacteriales bacterium]|nr:DUF1292 domain-containing protein [Eubacteriales bacterium]
MEDDRIIELVDDETGDTEKFVYMMTMDKNDRQFAILEPEELGEDEESEVVILEIVDSGEEEYDLVPVEDDALLDELFNEYLEAISEEEDAEDDGTEDGEDE